MLPPPHSVTLGIREELMPSRRRTDHDDAGVLYAVACGLGDGASQKQFVDPAYQ